MDPVDVEEFVRVCVAIAQHPFGTLLADTVEVFDTEDPGEVRRLAGRALRTAFEAHLAAQETWPEETDNDLLTAAFQALCAKGIVAREHFEDCQSCGVAAIGGEAGDVKAVRGYTFYHWQDAEAAADGRGLYLSYGVFEGGDGGREAIGHEVAEALHAHGVPVEWNGDVDTRISVPLAWRRRRVGRLAAYPVLVEPGTAPDRPVTLEKLDPWSGGLRRYAPDGGEISAAILTSVYLPWLPAGVKVRITDGASSMVVGREGVELVADGTVRVDRFHAEELFGGAVSAPAHEEPALETTYQTQTLGSEYENVLVGLDEAVDLVRSIPPDNGSWISFQGRSGGIVQLAWEDGELWLETPEVAQQRSIGKHVDRAEVARMLTVLATEDRVAVAELDNIQARAWG